MTGIYFAKQQGLANATSLFSRLHHYILKTQPCQAQGLSPCTPDRASRGGGLWWLGLHRRPPEVGGTSGSLARGLLRCGFLLRGICGTDKPVPYKTFQLVVGNGLAHSARIFIHKEWYERRNPLAIPPLKRTLREAFIATTPVMAGYVVLGMGLACCSAPRATARCGRWP